MENFSNILIAQTGWAILTLRIVLGVIFLMHGFRKAKNFKGTTEWFSSIGLKPGLLFAGLATVVELLGGLAILVGFMVQPFSLLLSVVMVVAAITNLRAKAGFFKVLELDLILLASLLLLATLDGGFFAIS